MRKPAAEQGIECADGSLIHYCGCGPLGLVPDGDDLAVIAGALGLTQARECVCESEFPATCGPECECFHHGVSAAMTPDPILISATGESAIARAD